MDSLRAIDLPYISPSSLDTFETNREEWAIRYALKERPPRTPQTQPMSLGSAFDAYIKAHLMECLSIPGPGFEQMFEKSVEPQHRDWAREHGRRVFEFYSKNGAVANLLFEMESAAEAPRFEADVARDVKLDGDTAYKLFGKTDIYFKNKGGATIILDWKCNGYCSAKKPSPKPGYINSHSGKMHRHASPLSFLGMIINASCKIENTDSKWATQLVMYAWSLGAEVGDQFVVGIEQIIALDGIYNFRAVASVEFQQDLHKRLCHMWECCRTGHIFSDLSLADNFAKLEQLEKAFKPSGDSSKDAWFNQITRDRGF
jgi:hypothetical protein